MQTLLLNLRSKNFDKLEFPFWMLSQYAGYQVSWLWKRESTILRDTKPCEMRSPKYLEDRAKFDQKLELCLLLGNED